MDGANSYFLLMMGTPKVEIMAILYFFKVLGGLRVVDKLNPVSLENSVISLSWCK